MTFRQPVPYLSARHVDGLYEKCLEFLSTRGVRIESDELNGRLADRGAMVDAETQMVRFPRSLVEEALACVPESFVLAAPDPAHDLPFPHPTGSFYFRTNTGGSSWLDPVTGEYRRVTSRDVAAWGRLTAHLQNVDWAGFQSPVDVPEATTDVHALHALLTNSAKHVWIQPYSQATIPHLIALCQAAAGGAEALRARPIVSIIASSLTPFAFKSTDSQTMMQATAAGIPLQIGSLPTAGGTAPVTEAGAVMVHAIEFTAMVAIIQLLSPGHPVIANPIAFSMDMHAGRALQSSPEAMRIMSTSTQFLKAALKVPTHPYGVGSDSPILDAQVPAEAAMLAMLMAMVGADVLGGGGQFDVANCVSPVQLVCDDEMVGALRKVVSEFSFDEEELAWKAIMETAPASSFLLHRHTRDHCRDAWRAGLYTRGSREVWYAKGTKDLWGRAKDRYFELMERPAPDAFSARARADMEDVVSAADRELVQ